MEIEPPLRLQQKLYQSARQWAVSNGVSLSRLGRLAVRDSSFFSRAPSIQGVTVSTLERFAMFLADAGNWQAGVVPDDVISFAHAVGVTSEDGEASTGNQDDMSGQEAA